MKPTSQFMKKSLSLAASLLALNLTPVFGHALTPEEHAILSEANRPTYTPRLAPRLGSPQAGAPVLTKFNLDFPGGTPKELVAAIEKAMGKPLNVIISSDENSAKAIQIGR